MYKISPILEEMKKPEIWNEVFSKFLKADSFDIDQKFSLSVLRKQKFYLEIIEDMYSGEFKWTAPFKVQIPKGNGKNRVVYIHPMKERFILSVFNRLYTRQHSDKVSKYVYSYKEGVKTMSAVKAILEDNEVFDKYSLKIDISAYFNSVSQSSLLEIVEDLTKDDPVMNVILRDLLFTNKVIINNKVTEEYMSLIPGCAFSSFLANVTLKDLDEKMAKLEGVTYARYSDDMIFFAEKREDLLDIDRMVLEELSKFGLKINPDKYVYYEPGEPFEFLGLRIYKDENNKKCIDIKSSGLKKMKRHIKSGVNRRRKRITMNNKEPKVELAKFFYDLNSKLYKTFIYNPSSFGWGYYVFNNVNVIDSLRELDFYLKERARYLYTGKNNKNNLNRISDEELYDLGMKSFVQMYILFKADMDFYKTEVRDIERVMADLTEKTDEEEEEDEWEEELEDFDDDDYLF